MSTIEDDVMVKPIEESTQYPHQERIAVEEINFIDRLNLEETVKQIAALKEIIANAPDVDAAKIAFIKEELLTGRYQIQTHRIAHRLLEHAQFNLQPEIA